MKYYSTIWPYLVKWLVKYPDPTSYGKIRVIWALFLSCVHLEYFMSNSVVSDNSQLLWNNLISTQIKINASNYSRRADRASKQNMILILINRWLNGAEKKSLNIPLLGIYGLINMFTYTILICNSSYLSISHLNTPAADPLTYKIPGLAEPCCKHYPSPAFITPYRNFRIAPVAVFCGPRTRVIVPAAHKTTGASVFECTPEFSVRPSERKAWRYRLSMPSARPVIIQVSEL